MSKTFIHVLKQQILILKFFPHLSTLVTQRANNEELSEINNIVLAKSLPAVLLLFLFQEMAS